LTRALRGAAICFIILFAILASSLTAQTPDIKAGAVDLTTWDFVEQGTISLNGEWLFASGFLYSDNSHKTFENLKPIIVPAAWNSAGYSGRGYGTYYIKLLFDRTGDKMGLKFGSASSSMRVFLDGIEVLSVGKPGDSPGSYIPRWYPSAVYFESSSEMELVIEVANFKHSKGGMRDRILIGSEAEIRSIVSRKSGIEFLLFGAILFMGIYHLVSYLILRNDKSMLWFALLSMLYSIRMLVTGEYQLSEHLPMVSWGLFLRVEYLTLYWMSYFFVTFFSHLFEQDFKKIVVKIATIGTLCFTAITIFLPVVIFTTTLSVFQLFILAAILYSCYITGKALFMGRFGARLMFSGLCLTFAIVIHDVLQNRGIIYSVPLLNYGLFLFMFFQAILLSLKFARNLHNIEVLSENLKQANTALRESQQKLQKQSIALVEISRQDALTELPNRIALFDSITKEIERAKRNESLVGVLLLDIDNFKDINDTMGPQFGDKLLMVVSQRLVGIIRQNDLIFRQGGDEFVIILLDTTRKEHLRVASDKVLESFSEPFIVEEMEIRVRATMGVSVFPLDGGDINSLMQNADMALYTAKHAHKGTILFYRSGMSKSSSEKLEMIARMPQALQEGCFQLAYQPQVYKNGKTVYGVEALIRWNDTELGMLSPGKFIPIAEESGFIIKLGDWILEEACLQGKKWTDEGLSDIHLSVNISAVQFENEGFTRRIKTTLDQTGFDPEYLVIELTEGIIMKNDELVIQKLDILRSFGVRISIDDFGTGYSSLAYLKKFPIDHLKIDQSFVNDIFNNNYDSEIIKTILGLAKILNIEVVAEGVETAEQHEFLDKNGCFFYQGFYFSKPLEAEEAGNYLGRAEKYIAEL
jgi:diguanylate cyclase (GGDEF)-like protein